MTPHISLRRAINIFVIAAAAITMLLHGHRLLELAALIRAP